MEATMVGTKLQKDIYAKLSAVLTDFEDMNADEEDLYEMLIEIQVNWENMGLSS